MHRVDAFHLSIMYEEERRNRVTFWALGPYLVLYRLFGLIPVCYQSEAYSLSWKTACHIFDRVTWSTILAKIYSAAIVALVMTYIFDELPALESLVSDDSAVVLLAANNFSICLNVFFTLLASFGYVGSRLIRLVNKMMCCEQDLSRLDCYLPVKIISRQIQVLNY